MSTSSKQVFLEYWLPWIMGQAGSWWLPMAQNHLQEDSNSLLASLACYANFAIFITGSLLEKQRKLFTKECCLNGQRRLLWVFHEGWEGITDIRKQWWCSCSDPSKGGCLVRLLESFVIFFHENWEYRLKVLLEEYYRHVLTSILAWPRW